MSNSKLRKELLADEPDREEVHRVAAAVLEFGRRINPTTRPLPAGCVAFRWNHGRIDQKTHASAGALERLGVGVALRTIRDIDRALWPQALEKEAQKAAKAPEKARKKSAPTKKKAVKKKASPKASQYFDPAPLNALEMSEAIQSVTTVPVLERILAAEQAGKNRGTHVQAIQERKAQLEE